MAKLTSQNSSKSKTAKSRNANDKTTAEEKKPKSLSRKTGSSNGKVSPVEAKDKLQPEPVSRFAHFGGLDEWTLCIRVEAFTA